MAHGYFKDWEVRGNFFEGLFKPTRKLFKKKKRYPLNIPNPHDVVGKYNLSHNPLKSKVSLWQAPPIHSGKTLKSKVTIYGRK